MDFIWETLQFEEILRAALVRDLQQAHGDTRFGYYTIARAHLLEDVLDEIKAIQPKLTDHGPKHIRNVLENIGDLMGDDIGNWHGDNETLTGGKLSGIELYVLGMTALFHDVGNIFDREEHQKQIGTIYDYARPSSGSNQEREEKELILSICKAHCGDGLDGTKNTLRFVAEHSKLHRKSIRPRLLAPLLRFADELAEGQQRTSHFMIRHHNYPTRSVNFHRYADCSSVDIDRHHGRIRLKYHINLTLPNEATTRNTRDDGATIPIRRVGRFLQFVYQRVEKLNQERQYCKHYCPILDPFKETSATFNFWHNDEQIPIDLPSVIFSDLVVPGDPRKTVVDQDGRYNPKTLAKNLHEALIRIYA